MPRPNDGPTAPATSANGLARVHRTGRLMLGVSGVAALGAISLSLVAARETKAVAAQTVTGVGVTANAPATAIPSRIPAGGNQLADAAFARFIGEGVWRAGACDGRGNFQKFAPQAARVEVGSGHPGEGEQLTMLAARRTGDLIEVETRVCAPDPIGCNQTFEQYKVLGQDRLQEWHFEGRLPGQEPYVLVTQGRSTQDASEGRTFTRCDR